MRTLCIDDVNMKILHLNTQFGGGAARAALRLHTALGQMGHHSSFFTLDRTRGDAPQLVYRRPRTLSSLCRRKWRQWRTNSDQRRYQHSRPPGFPMFSDDRAPQGVGLLQQLPAADVINIHWVAGLVDYREFLGRASRRSPLVWTLHDMNAFTGGCHHAHNCGRYAQACGQCPQLGSQNPADLSHQIWRRKRKAFADVAKGRLHVVTPSRWLFEELQRSSLLGKHPCSLIPNGLDVAVFAPRDRRFARQLLGLPVDAKIILFVAASLERRHKGLQFLVEALRHLDRQSNLCLVSVGARAPVLDLPVIQRHLGTITEDRLMSVAYNAADVFVIPSLMDTLPNTAMEAIACGIPVVGFNVGGIPDMVRPGVTGLLVPAQDIGGLASAIDHLLDNHALRSEMAGHCRQVAVAEYSLEVQARRYIELYQTLLDHAGLHRSDRPADENGGLE